MESAGTVRPSGTDAHHIVAGGAGSAAEARAILARFDIDINAAENGVFLPSNTASVSLSGSAVHSRVHTDAYYSEVNRLLS